ncbi:redoxin domain-containing protein [bacterium]|nr:redoxin domain-containing protein [bacterium]
MSLRDGRTPCALALTLLALAVCGCREEDAPPKTAGAPGPRGASKPSSLAFRADTLDGWTYDLDAQNARRRQLVYLVDVTKPWAARCTKAAQRVHAERQAHHLDVIGVVVPPGYNPRSARPIPKPLPTAQALAALARKHLASAGADFPCVVDPTAAIAEGYRQSWGGGRLDGLPAFYPFPARARHASVRPVFAYYALNSKEPGDYLYRRVLRRFGIDPSTDVDPLAGHYPEAPDVALTDSAGKTQRLADLRGKVVVLVFAASHCPQCEKMLAFLGGLVKTHGARLTAFAVMTDVGPDRLAAFAKERRLGFPVASDAEWVIRSAFRYRGATPDAFVIDGAGRIRFRHRGYRAGDESMLTMEVASLLGTPTKPLLREGRYSGDGACRVCHAKEHVDWTLTRHACAWDTLVRLGKENDPKCVRCHVVGAGERGGFVSGSMTPQLRRVQCESCHGQNGCKAFNPTATAAVREAVCRKCHDALHSPRFDLKTYAPRVQHDQGAELAKLSRPEREKRLKGLCSAPGSQVFGPPVPYVGSAVCATCHPTEHKSLKAGFHFQALRTLEKPGPDRWNVPAHKRGVVGIRKPECVRCHVTGYGRPGGYPKTVPTAPHASPLAGVGCEACHGPGKAHADDPKKPNAIARLSGTCPECNILPICRQCHDDANSPRFDYAKALERARHAVGRPVEPAR